MSLKDAATRAAVLTALAEAVNAELKDAKAELQAELKAAKKETGTKKIAVSLPNGPDIGEVTLVEPKAVATVGDPKAFLDWARKVRPSEVSSRLVTEVRPSWAALVLKEATAAGTARWCDPETGEIHDLPGVQMQGRAAYTRLTLPDDGREAIAAAYQEWKLAHLGLPQLAAGGAS